MCWEVPGCVIIKCHGFGEVAISHDAQSSTRGGRPQETRDETAMPDCCRCRLRTGLDLTAQSSRYACSPCNEYYSYRTHSERRKLKLGCQTAECTLLRLLFAHPSPDELDLGFSSRLRRACTFCKRTDEELVHDLSGVFRVANILVCARSVRASNFNESLGASRMVSGILCHVVHCTMSRQ